MSGIFGLPGIGKQGSPHDTIAYGVALFTSVPSGKLVTPFLIQNYQFDISERTQEVTTLAETEHLYTFGRNLTRLTITGYFLNDDMEGAEQIEGGNFTSKDLLTLWDNEIRAKKAGEAKTPSVEVRLSTYVKTFKCVPIAMNVSHSVDTEALIQASITMIVMSEIGRRVT